MNGHRSVPAAPILIGGAAAGILSGIPLVNCLCCLWILGGAALAVHLAARERTGPVSAGDGALIGAFTGVVAAAANALVGLPLQAVNAAFMRRIVERLAAYGDNFPAGWREWFDRGPGPFSIAWFLVGLAISAAVFAALGALGGVLGASLFGRKKVSAPPQPQ